MDKKDKKDEIILQQLEVIQTLTEHNLRRMGTDFWGSPLTPEVKTPEAPSQDAPKSPASSQGKPGAPEAPQTAGARTEPQEEAPPPEKLEDLQKELDGYIGLAAVKKEVRNLIDLVKVHQLREENGLPVTEVSALNC